MTLPASIHKPSLPAPDDSEDALTATQVLASQIATVARPHPTLPALRQRVVELLGDALGATEVALFLASGTPPTVRHVASSAPSAPRQRPKRSTRDALRRTARNALIAGSAVEGGAVAGNILAQPLGGGERWGVVVAAWEVSTPAPADHWQARQTVLAQIAPALEVLRAAPSGNHPPPAVRHSSAPAGEPDVPGGTDGEHATTTNFLAMVSHELRTPLHTLGGFLDIVLEGHVGPLNEKQREFLSYAHESAQQLARLVEDLFVIGRADTGQFHLQRGWVDVAAVAQRAILATEASAAAGEVTLSTDLAPDLPALYADGHALQQVLCILLANALAATPTGGNVRLVVSQRRTDGTDLLFTVSDTGAGIAAEEREQIFERFYRSMSGTRAQPRGHGLALAIARLIVEQHHGRIWVEDSPAEGASISFVLPKDHAPG